MYPAPRPCLLCRHPQSRTVASLTGGQLNKLWSKLGFDLSTDARGELTESVSVELCRCSQCAFEFYSPCLAGGETFYRELEHAQYFGVTKREFTETLGFARRHHVRRILDVGCGGGAFLDLARAAGFEASGSELNQAVAERVRARGHTVFTEALTNVEPFDLITLFQVLEHLPNPTEAIREAARLLKPGGYLAVAVPNAAGVMRLDFWDPYEWPPHHVTRWRRRDLRSLAAQCDLKLVELGGDPLEGSEIRHYWLTHNKLAPVLGVRPHVGGSLIPKVVGGLYRLLCLKAIFPKWGHSIYAFYRRA